MNIFVGLILLISVLLAGCGGGGGSPQITTILDNYSTFFTQVNDGIPDDSSVYKQFPNNKGSLFLLIPIDVNHDGKKDLVASYWTSVGQLINDQPCPDSLVIYIQQSNGTYLDKTSTILSGSAKLGGCSRDFKIADLNGDGYPDIVFSMAQEDGRLASIPVNMQAYNMILLSKPAGGYTIAPIGNSNWWNAISVGYDADNKPFVAAGAYTNLIGPTNYEVIKYQSGSWVDISSRFPSLTTDLMIFTNEDDSKTKSTYLIQNEGNQNTIDLKLYSLTPGGWTVTSELKNQSSITVPIIQNFGNNGATTQQTFINLNGKYVNGGFIQSNCTFRFSPNSEPIHVINWAGQALPSNYLNGQTIDLRVTTLPFYHELTGWVVANGSLTQRKLNIDNPDSDSNINFIACQDVDGDGYMDIIMYLYNSTGRPIIYKNNKNGGLSRFDTSSFPSAPKAWVPSNLNSATSVYEDLNDDGIPDLIIWPANSGFAMEITSVIKPLLYFGKKLIGSK